jgi:hypothetical protein
MKGYYSFGVVNGVLVCFFLIERGEERMGSVPFPLKLRRRLCRDLNPRPRSEIERSQECIEQVRMGGGSGGYPANCIMTYGLWQSWFRPVTLAKTSSFDTIPNVCPTHSLGYDSSLVSPANNDRSWSQCRICNSNIFFCTLYNWVICFDWLKFDVFFGPKVVYRVRKQKWENFDNNLWMLFYHLLLKILLAIGLCIRIVMASF